VLRTGATFVVRSLLALLAVCCCTISALAQDGKTYWQVHTGGGAAMSLEGGTLRFAEQIGRVAVGTVYFSGQRSGRSIRGVFSYSLTQVSRCPPVHSGELILSEDGRSFTLTNGAVSNPERVSGCSEPTPNSSVIRGDQIHWPSRQVVAAIPPPVTAQVRDVAPPAKAVVLAQAEGFQEKSYWRITRLAYGYLKDVSVVSMTGGSAVLMVVERGSVLARNGDIFLQGSIKAGVLSGYYENNLFKCRPRTERKGQFSADGKTLTLTDTWRQFREGDCSEFGEVRSYTYTAERIQEPEKDAAAWVASAPRSVVAVPAPPPAIAKAEPPKTMATPRAWFAIGVPDKTEPVLVAMFLLAVWWFLVRDNSVGWFVTRLVKWVALRLALVGVVVVLLLAPISWVEQKSALIRTEGTFFHWLRFNVSIPVATVLNRIAPYCGTSLLSTPAGAYSSFATFENVLPPPHGSRCEASIAALVTSVLSFNVSTLTGWIASAWAWVYAAFAWVFGGIWAWVSAPFVWVFSPVSGVLWWLATPFINFFWLVYTLIAWVLWLVHQLIVWMAWAVWIAGAWGVWLLGYFVYYLAIIVPWGAVTIGSLLWSAIGYLVSSLMWFAINVGNYVIAIALVLGGVLLSGRRMFDGFINTYGSEAKARKQREADAAAEAQARAQREEDERTRAGHPSGVSLGAFHNAKADFGIKDMGASLNEDDMRKLRRQLLAKAHPDRGGKREEFEKLERAWLIICKRENWRP